MSLQKKMWLKNINQVPKIDKVVVSIWIGSLTAKKWLKSFDEIEKNLIKITWQKPKLVKSTKAISNFKLRIWMPVMLQTTLRRKKAYDFLAKFNQLVLPRVRDFSWLSDRSFDARWNINIWLKSYDMFPELAPDDVTIPIWLQINIVTTASKLQWSRSLLEELWFVFKK